jgi:hypothetical protein
MGIDMGSSINGVPESISPGPASFNPAKGLDVLLTFSEPEICAFISNELKNKMLITSKIILVWTFNKEIIFIVFWSKYSNIA